MSRGSCTVEGHEAPTDGETDDVELYVARRAVRHQVQHRSMRSSQELRGDAQELAPGTVNVRRLLFSGVVVTTAAAVPHGGPGEVDGVSRRASGGAPASSSTTSTTRPTPAKETCLEQQGVDGPPQPIQNAFPPVGSSSTPSVEQLQQPSCEVAVRDEGKAMHPLRNGPPEIKTAVAVPYASGSSGPAPEAFDFPHHAFYHACTSQTQRREEADVATKLNQSYGLCPAGELMQQKRQGRGSQEKSGGDTLQIASYRPFDVVGEIDRDLAHKRRVFEEHRSYRLRYGI